MCFAISYFKKLKDSLDDLSSLSFISWLGLSLLSLMIILSLLSLHTKCHFFSIKDSSHINHDHDDNQNHRLVESQSSIKRQPLSIFVASSLQYTLEQWMKDSFNKTREGLHPKVQMKLQGAASQRLYHWIQEGVQVDWLISAHEKYILPLLKDHGFSWSMMLGCTPLVILTTESTSSMERPLEVLKQWGLEAKGSIAIAAPEVPLGVYTQELLERGAHVWGERWRERVLSRVKAQGVSARSTLSYFLLGEVDSVIIYASHIENIRAQNIRSFKQLYPPNQLKVVGQYFMAGRDQYTQSLAHQFQTELFSRSHLGVHPCPINSASLLPDSVELPK